MTEKLLAILIVFLTLTATARAAQVTITDEVSHYRVRIDLTDSVSLAEAAAPYAEAIKDILPGYPALVDSYLSEIVGGDALYTLFLMRADLIKQNLDQDHRELVDGLAAALADTEINDRGDDRLSADEFVVLALITDVARLTQCSAGSVYGGRSAIGATISYRNLEWKTGSQKQAPKLQAVTTIVDGADSVFMFGYLGFLGALSIINNDGVFAAVLDSNTLYPYSAAGKRSYIFDLLKAVRTLTTMDDVAAYMADDSRDYAFNHNIFLADPDSSQVLENNLTGYDFIIGSDYRRAVRREDSALNPGVEWGVDNAVVTVNSFVLKGNVDNHTVYRANYARWNNLRAMLGADDSVDFEDMKAIAAHKAGPTPGADEGDIYRGGEQQMIVIQPGDLAAEVFFRPKEGSLPEEPVFESVVVSFD